MSRSEEAVDGPTEEASASLVEIEPGIAVLFGDDQIADFDVVPFEMMNSQARQRLTDQLAVATGIGNVAAQAAQGMQNAQGLVRLTPKTLKDLKTLKPMRSAGENLGALVDSNSTIRCFIRWEPATAAQSAQILSSLGPAATLLALQVQMASMSQRLDENIQVTRDVLMALHQDQWARLQGLHETTLRAVREARAAGVVNDHAYSPISTREPDLRSQRLLFTEFVDDHVKALDTDIKGRRAYIQKHAERIIADAHGMLMAEGSWHRAQVLRAAHILRDEANAAENEGLLAQLVAETKREHTRSMDKLADLLGRLETHSRLTAELPGEWTLPFISKRQSDRDTAVMAMSLAEHVAALRNRVHTRPAELDPAVEVFEEGSPQDILRILRWILPGEGPLLALADVNLDRRGTADAYLGVTPKRFFISTHNAVRKEGVIEHDFALTDVRYVRFRERGKQTPEIEIITKDENIKLTFSPWAASGTGLEAAQRVGNLLAAAMNLPESERRTDPLLNTDVLPEGRPSNVISAPQAEMTD